MATSKSPSRSSPTGPGGKPGSTPSSKSGSKSGSKSAKSLQKAGGSARPPSKGRPGKSIVNQKQTPWGLISAAVAVVLFAAAVVVVVVATHKSGSDSASGGDGTVTNSVGGQSVKSSDRYRQPEFAGAKAISGVTYRVQANHTHVTGLVNYDTSPPTGGDHAPLWADCTGVVYTHQLANENAVHALEHGAVWVTYNPDKLSKSQVATLAKDVNGVDHTLMTPYAGLKTPVSLQAWGYQLFVNSPTDPRIEKFIKTLAGNTATWPEVGASCTDPYWNASRSKPGSPQETA